MARHRVLLTMPSAGIDVGLLASAMRTAAEDGRVAACLSVETLGRERLAVLVSVEAREPGVAEEVAAREVRAALRYAFTPDVRARAEAPAGAS